MVGWENPPKVVTTIISAKCTFSHSEVYKGDSTIWSTFESHKGECPCLKPSELTGTPKSLDSKVRILRRRHLNWYRMKIRSKTLRTCNFGMVGHEIHQFWYRRPRMWFWSEYTQTADFHARSFRNCSFWEFSIVFSCGVNLGYHRWIILIMNQEILSFRYQICARSFFEAYRGSIRSGDRPYKPQNERKYISKRFSWWPLWEGFLNPPLL